MSTTKPQHSLITQLSLRIVILSLVALFALTLNMLGGLVIATFNEQTRLNAQASAISREIDMTINRLTSAMNAMTIGLVEYRNPEPLLSEFMTRHDHAYAMFIVKPDNTVHHYRQRITTNDDIPETLDEQPWLETSGVYLGEVFFVDDTPFMTLAVPVYSNTLARTREATLITHVDLTSFWQSINQRAASPPAYAYMVNESGRLLTYSTLVSEEIHFTDYAPATPAEYVNHHSPFTHVYRGLKNVIVVSSIADMATINWFVVIEHPVSDLAQQLYIPFVLATLGITAILAIILTIFQFMQTRVLSPLSAFNAHAQRVQAGDMASRITHNTPYDDEIAHLSQTLNSMADRVEQRTHELEIANAKALESSRLKTEFLSVISHELRTPLNAIIGYCGIILEGMGGQIDDSARKMIGRIDSNSQRLLKLINELLELPRIEAGEVEFAPELFDPRQLLQTWDEQARVLVEQKGLQFNVHADDTLPHTLYADTHRLTQIVMNLIDNAVKFTSEGKITLTLAYHVTQWEIVVTDTGIGIPEHAHKFIFDQFRQVDSSPTREFDGTGLGLSIVRDLTQLMGGRVSVESSYGAGSTFRVWLPVVLGPND